MISKYTLFFPPLHSAQTVPELEWGFGALVFCECTQQIQIQIPPGTMCFIPYMLTCTKQIIHRATCKFQTSFHLCQLWTRNCPTLVPRQVHCYSQGIACKFISARGVAEAHHGARGVRSAFEFWELNDPQWIIQQSGISISGKGRNFLLSKCSRIHRSKRMQNKTAACINLRHKHEKLGGISGNGFHLS